MEKKNRYKRIEAKPLAVRSGVEAIVVVLPKMVVIPELKNAFLHGQIKFSIWSNAFLSEELKL